MLLASPYALGSSDLRDRVQVCVCTRGGMAGCLAGPWWGYVHVQLRAANDWVLVGGRTMFSLCCILLWGVGSGARWVGVKSVSRVGHEWAESGSGVGQYWASRYSCVQPVVDQGKLKSDP